MEHVGIKEVEKVLLRHSSANEAVSGAPLSLGENIRFLAGSCQTECLLTSPACLPVCLCRVDSVWVDLSGCEFFRVERKCRVREQVSVVVTQQINCTKNKGKKLELVKLG